MATKVATETKLTPLGDRLVVKPSAREETTKSGIVLPDTVKERPQEGKILAVRAGHSIGSRQDHACPRSGRRCRAVYADACRTRRRPAIIHSPKQKTRR